MFEPAIIFGIAVLGFLAIGLSLGALVQSEQRQRALHARMARAASGSLGDPGLGGPRTRSLLAEIVRQLHRVALISGERVSIMRGGEARRSAELLQTAGIRNRDALVVYTFLKTVLPLLAVLIAALWCFQVSDPRPTVLGFVATMAATGLVVSKAPDLYLRGRRARRLQTIRRGFPDMLELLVIASEAGLGVHKALGRVTHELRAAQPLLAEELAQMVTELNMTGPRGSAYSGFSARVPLPEVSIFTQTLLQSEKYGTPFATAMRTLMRDQRADRLLRIEEQAARLPALMTFPLILFIMPAVFVVLVGPAALAILDNIMGTL